MPIEGERRLRWSLTCSEHLMDPTGRRADHVLAVTALAASVGHAFGPDRELLVAAAALHDIGYSPEITHTGFHPLDGARVVREAGFEQLACLVAHHSGARNEARLRGIEGYCDEFPYGDSDLDRALTYCDLTTGPDGRRVTLEDRIAEIQERYGPDHVVAQAIRIGTSEFEQARDATERLMAEAGVVVTGSLAYPPTSSR